MALFRTLAYLLLIALIIALFFSLINVWPFFPIFIFSLFMSLSIGTLINLLTALTWKRMHIQQKPLIGRGLYWAALIAAAVCLGTLVGTSLYRWLIHGTTVTIPRRFFSYLLLFNALIAVIATVVEVIYGNLKAGIEHKARENQELQLRQVQTQLAALSAKVNPHFLFNTLNTMLSLVKKDPDKAEKMILNLSDIYHRILRHSESEQTTLGDEITLLREYLEIEKIRLGDRLSYAIDVESTLLQAKLLPLLLEPVVENAVIHGIAPKPGGGCISIAASRGEGTVRITVSDDGVGLGQTDANGGFGLRSIRERLLLAYRDRARIEVQPLPGGGTSVLLEIPLED